MLFNEFKPVGTYLDTATYGLPATTALSRLATVTTAWSEGRYDPADCDAAVASARSAFARLHRVSPGDVAIDDRTDLVAVSAVQSADGRVADLEAIATAVFRPSGRLPCNTTYRRRHAGR